MNVEDRVKLLKFQISEQIKEKQRNADLIPPMDDTEDNYHYVEINQGPVTPVMDTDERKKDGKFKVCKTTLNLMSSMARGQCASACDRGS
jgi:hypothetical protein